MNHEEQYVDRQKKLAFALDCNFINLLKGVPNIEELLEFGGFDKDYIATVTQGIGYQKSLVFYIPSFVKIPKDVQVFEKSFDEVIKRDEFRNWMLIEHRNNLLLLVLLLHDYYFLDGNGNSIYRIQGGGLFHELTNEELPEITQELVRGKEVADLLEILLRIRQKTSPIHIQVDNSHAIITNNGLRIKLTDGLETTLENSTYDDLGAGLALMTKYEKYKRTGDDNDLRRSICLMKAAKKISPAPQFNTAVASFSLLLRNYLVCNSVPNTRPVWPKDLLMFIEELFVLLNVSYTRSPDSIKKLRKTIEDYTKGHQIDPEEIVI